MLRKQLAERRHGNIEDIGSPSLCRHAELPFILEPTAAKVGPKRTLRRVGQSHEPFLARRRRMDELGLLKHEPEVWQRV